MIQSVPVFLPHFAATTCFYFMSLRQTVRLLNSYLVAEQAVWTILLWGMNKNVCESQVNKWAEFCFYIRHLLSELFDSDDIPVKHPPR